MPSGRGVQGTPRAGSPFMREPKHPTRDVEDAKRLRKEPAEIRRCVAPAVERLREQRAAMRRALRAVAELLQTPPTENWKPSRW